MKKSTKIYLWAWVPAILALVTFIIYPSHHDLASDPDKLGAIVNLRLPDIVDSKYENNLDRGTSCWDFYEYHAYFSENISEECIAEMERRCVEDSEHWSKNESEGYYLYTDNGGTGELYEVGCAIFEDQAHVAYLVSEDEGGLVFAIIWLYIQILIAWGVILLIIAAVTKRVKREIANQSK